MYWLILIIIWLICGTISYGFSFAYFQNPPDKELYRFHQVVCFLISYIFGPIALVTYPMAMGRDAFKYGMKFK